MFGCDGIYGGNLLGVRASNSLSFYDWESQDLIRRIEIQVKHVSAAWRRVDWGIHSSVGYWSPGDQNTEWLTVVFLNEDFSN